jgi:hypothetical protein
MSLAVNEMDAAAGDRLRERRESIVLEHVAAENRHDVAATIATFDRPDMR